MKSVKLCKARGGRKCVQHVGGPTVTLSKHGSLAQGLFWDPLVAPWPRGGTRGATKALKTATYRQQDLCEAFSLNGKFLILLKIFVNSLQELFTHWRYLCPIINMCLFGLFSEAKIYDLHICCWFRGFLMVWNQIWPTDPKLPINIHCRLFTNGFAKCFPPSPRSPAGSPPRSPPGWQHPPPACLATPPLPAATVA